MSFFKKDIITILISIALAMALQAQPISAVKDSTNGLFSDEMDNVVSTTGWKSADFQQYFLSGSYGLLGNTILNGNPATTFNTNVLNVAAMFQVKQVRLGLSYTGGIAGDIEVEHAKNITDDTYMDTSSIPMTHNAQALVGMPIFDTGLDLGIKFGLNASGEKSENETAEKKPTERDTRVFTPNIALGTSFSLSGWTVTPQLQFSLAIANAGRAKTNVAGEFYAADIGPVLDAKGEIYQQTRKYRMYTPSGELSVGVGFPVDNFTLQGNLAYNISYSFMPEKYEVSIVDGIKTEHEFKTDKVIANTVTIHFTGRKAFMEKLNLAGRAYLQINQKNLISGGSIINTTSNTASQTVEEKSVEIRPRLYLAGTYDFSEKLSIGAGITFDPFVYTYSTSHSKDEGVKVGNEIEEEKHSFAKPIVSHVGFSVKITPIKNFIIQIGTTLPDISGTDLKSIDGFLGGNIRLSATWKK